MSFYDPLLDVTYGFNVLEKTHIEAYHALKDTNAPLPIQYVEWLQMELQNRTPTMVYLIDSRNDFLSTVCAGVAPITILKKNTPEYIIECIRQDDTLCKQQRKSLINVLASMPTVQMRLLKPSQRKVVAKTLLRIDGQTEICSNSIIVDDAVFTGWSTISAHNTVGKLPTVAPFGCLMSHHIRR